MKIISISEGKQQGKVVTQRDLVKQRELDRAAEKAIEERDAHFAWIERALEAGAIVEPGPLKATLKTKKILVLHGEQPARSLQPA